MPRTKFKKKTSASGVYAKQNRLLHWVFSWLGYPYEAERGYWLPVLSDMLGKKVNGISSLTLGERDRILRAFSRRYPEAEIHTPWVPAGLRGWRKGRADVDAGSSGQLYKLRRAVMDAAPDLENREKRLRGLCRKHAGVDDIRWCCDVKALKQILTVIRREAEKEVR